MFGTFVGAQPFFNDAVAGVIVAVKSGYGQLTFLNLTNTTAAVAYLQIFDLASGSVNLGTTVPKWVVRLAANQTLAVPMLLPLDLGKLNGSTAGISMAGTTGAGNAVGAAISVSAMFA